MTFCTECGARFASDTAFCTGCGATRPRSGTAATGPSTGLVESPLDGVADSPGSRRGTIAWTVSAFVLALALVVGGGLALTSGDDEPAGSESAAALPPSPSGSAEPTAAPETSATPVPSPVEESLPAFPSPSATAQQVTPKPTPTVSPSAVVLPQQEPVVQEALDLSEDQAAQILLGDEAAALNSLRAGRWYPFLSSKCAGMGAYAPLEEPLDMGPPGRIGMPDGVGEGYSFLGSNRILALQRYYQSRFGPEVVNATTQGLGRKTTYEGLCGPYPMWITINAGVSFSKPSDALAWCRENGFIAFECGAFPAFMPEKGLKRLGED